MLTHEFISYIYNSSNSYYHCDFLVSETTAILTKIGAKDISVNCNGGLPSTTPNFVEARFTALKETPVDKSTHIAKLRLVDFKFNSSCDLHESIVEEVLKAVEVYDLKQNISCWNSSGRAYYRFKTLSL